jgi:hypothetical protein
MLSMADHGGEPKIQHTGQHIWRCGADIPSQNGNIGFPKIRH